MFKKHFFAAFGALLCCAGIVLSQPVQESLLTGTAIWGLDPAKLITQYVHESWQAEHGLPQNTVQSLCQTRDGYIWIGTVEGAARFDGVRFEIFNKRTFPLLSNHDINHIIERHDGSLWLGADDGSLYCLYRGKWTRYGKEQGLGNGILWQCYEDRLHGLWISTVGGGLLYAAPSAAGTLGAITRYDKTTGLRSNDVHQVIEDHDGSMFIATRGAGLHRLHRGKWTYYTTMQGLPSDAVYSLLRSNNGTVWIGTDKGLAFLQNDAIQVLHEQQLDKLLIRGMLEDRAGSLWIGSSFGIWRLYHNRFTRFSTEHGLNSNDIWTFIQDHEGSLWIGTLGGGLSRLKDTRFTAITARQGLKTGFVWNVFEDSSGTVWTGTNSGGLFKILDNTAMEVVKPPRYRNYSANDTSSGIQKVYGMYQDRQGALWFTTWGNGLYSLYRGEWSHFTTQEGLLSNNLWGIFQDRTGAIWIASGSAGLQRWYKGTFKIYTTANGLASNLVRRLYEDRQGNLWIGTDNGVHIIRHDSIIATFGKAQGMNNTKIRAFLEDSSGGMWIGTMSGLHYLRNNQFSVITTKEGLFDDVIMSILDDGQGKFWFSCNRGIFSVHKRDVENLVLKKFTRLYCTVYGQDDGMPSAECNSGNPSAWKLRDGRLAFPTAKGVVLFYPQALQRNSLPPPVHIEKIVVNNDSVITPTVYHNNRLTMPTGTEKIRIQFTALSLVAPQRVQFKYILEGFESEWTDAGTRREAFYTQIPRGRWYKFCVIACNNDGVWNQTGASMDLYVAPYWFETPWFYGICIIVALGTGFAAYRWNVRRLRIRAVALERVVRERTHELRKANNKIQRQMHLLSEKSQELELRNKQLHQLNDELSSSNQALNEANLFKMTMLSVAAHDLKNPLGTIVGFTEALEEIVPPDSPEQRFIKRIATTADRMLALVKDLLDTAAVGLGKMELFREMMNIALLVREVGETYMPAAMEKQQTLAITLPAECWIYADWQRIRQVVDNLISNAIKYSLHKTTIHVVLQLEQDTLRFLVQDEGPGLTADDQAKLFLYFQRLSAQPTGNESSTGVGLAISKQIVELHGGAIRCKSTPGQGATFIVELPVKPPATV